MNHGLETRLASGPARRIGSQLLLIVIAAAALPVLPARAAEPTGKAADLRPFLQQHCVACHGAEVHERGLPTRWAAGFADKDMSTLGPGAGPRDAAFEVPPRERPSRQASDYRVHTKPTRSTSASHSSLAKQPTNSRVLLRRLNRTEYETTLRDLLGIQVEVKDLCLNRTRRLQFDNVNAWMLDTSMVRHIEVSRTPPKAVLVVSAADEDPRASLEAAR